jgi:nucleotide-binding universal stress UspA family protein
MQGSAERAGGDMPEQRGRVVVGVDGSEQSKQALCFAVGIAEITGCTTDAVTVWDMPTSYGWAIAAEDWNPEQDASKVLSRTVAEVLDGHRPAGCVSWFARATVPRRWSMRASARTCWRCSRGHGGFAGLLLGSVSANCAEHAQCPVLVVHGPPAPSTPE